MSKFNKQLTALALLTVTSIAGTMVTVTAASAQNTSNSCSRTVKDVTLKSKDGDQFCSDKGVEDVSAAGFKDRVQFIAVANGEKWNFYPRANFKGKPTQIGPDEARTVNNLKVGSFCAIKNCPK